MKNEKNPELTYGIHC